MTIGAIDLFCGIGGLTYGLKKAGIDVVAGIDADTACRYAFETNNYCKFIGQDIKLVDSSFIEDALKGYDIKVIVGCAPCQPFSNHQKNKFLRKLHKDWGLLHEFLRIITDIKPDIVSMENVPQLRNEEVFYDFMQGLKHLDYHIDFKIVNAADFGVPQRRRRLLLLASRFGAITLKKPTHANKHITVRNVIQNLSPIHAGETDFSDVLHTAPSLSELNIKRIKASKPGGNWKDWSNDLICQCHKRENGKSYSSVYGRMEWDNVSPTITTQFNCYGTGRFGHPEQDRAISLREGALLQSFPKKYQFSEKGTKMLKSAIAKHIGNAVPPRLGFVIGKSIMEHLKQREINNAEI